MEERSFPPAKRPYHSLRRLQQQRRCAVVCGYYGQLCCQADQVCSTNTNTQAFCAPNIAFVSRTSSAVGSAILTSTSSTMVTTSSHSSQHSGTRSTTTTSESVSPTIDSAATTSSTAKLSTSGLHGVKKDAVIAVPIAVVVILFVIAVWFYE
jgi:preprotein translocase subunit SecF